MKNIILKNILMFMNIYMITNNQNNKKLIVASQRLK